MEIPITFLFSLGKLRYFGHKWNKRNVGREGLPPLPSHIPISITSPGIQRAKPASWALGPSHNACPWFPPLGFPTDWGLASHPHPRPPPSHASGPALFQR